MKKASNVKIDPNTNSLYLFVKRKYIVAAKIKKIISGRKKKSR